MVRLHLGSTTVRWRHQFSWSPLFVCRLIRLSTAFTIVSSLSKQFQGNLGRINSLLEHCSLLHSHQKWGNKAQVRSCDTKRVWFPTELCEPKRCIYITSCIVSSCCSQREIQSCVVLSIGEQGLSNKVLRKCAALATESLEIVSNYSIIRPWVAVLMPWLKYNQIRN